MYQPKHVLHNPYHVAAIISLGLKGFVGSCCFSLGGLVLSIIFSIVSAFPLPQLYTQYFALGPHCQFTGLFLDFVFNLFSFVNNAETELSDRGLQFLKSIHLVCFANFLLVPLPNYPTCGFLLWSSTLLRDCPSPITTRAPVPYLVQYLKVTQCEMSSYHPMI